MIDSTLYTVSKCSIVDKERNPSATLISSSTNGLRQCPAVSIYLKNLY